MVVTLPTEQKVPNSNPGMGIYLRVDDKYLYLSYFIFYYYILCI